MTTTEATPLTSPASTSASASGNKAFTIQWRNPERRLIDYVAAVWQGKVVMLVAAGIATLAGTFVALTKPNTYASTATLMVHSTAHVGSASEAAANLVGAGQILPTQVVNAVEIVTSSDVLRRVVGRIGPKEILKPYQPIRVGKREDMGFVERITDAMHDLQARWFAPSGDEVGRYNPMELIETAVATLDQRLVVWPSARGTTLNLTYTDHDPQRAKAVLQSVIDEAGLKYTEVFAPPQGQDWIGEQVMSAERRKGLAEAALAQFQEEHGVIDFSDEHKLINAELAKQRLEQDSRKIRLKSHTEAIEILRERLLKLQQFDRRATQEQEQRDTLRENLEQQLANLEIELAGVKKKFADATDQTDFKILTVQIDAIKSKIAEREPMPLLGTFASTPNPEYLDVESQLRRKTDELGDLQREIPMFDALIAEKTAELAERHKLQEEATKKQKELKEAEAEYEKLQSASKTYEISRELDTRGLKALREIEPPSLPLTKEGPKRGRLILGGFAGGFLIAFTWILMRTRLSRKLMTPTDVTFALGRADVVGIPMLTSRNVRRFEAARLQGWH